MGVDEHGNTPPTPLSAHSGRARATLIWCGVAVLLVLAFAAALGALQRGLYSAGGFVSSYVDSLADGNAEAALQMPGADPTAASLSAQGLPAKASRELLRADMLPELQNVQVLGDHDLGNGEHLVDVRVRVAGRSVTAGFTVQQTGAVFGVLPTWRFSRTPLAVAHVTVEHADTFTLAGHTLDPRAVSVQPNSGFRVSADYLVFSPGIYRLGHTSHFLGAPKSILTVPSPGRTVDVSVVASPNTAFVTQVDKQLRQYLDSCAQQTVLQPTGCPFGVSIDDRVQGVPRWSITTYPPVTIVAGADGWTMPNTAGTARLSVTVQSLFDGSIHQRTTDEAFAVSISSMTIHEDGTLDITVSN